jgi:hypothetical protein
VSITEAYLIAEPDDYALQAENEYNAEWFRDYLPPGEEPLEPVSDIYYPILQDYHEKFNHQDRIGEEKLVGLLSFSVYWRDFIRNSLPEGSKGVYVVLESDCNPSFT